MKLYAVIRPGAKPIITSDPQELNNDQIDRGYSLVSWECEVLAGKSDTVNDESTPVINPDNETPHGTPEGEPRDITPNNQKDW